ncbi:enolase C-terminal domain-like protein [Daejeonella lutea]|uniref:Mannonate dehydratase n=1 Tax=Daejeonella lutea TaxID=572036 RepID=A0A1T5ADU5_9SPHI|nr:enolase C-terminal domain-like protein [Daejeonella lutea]SKB32843.1 mannonate dehydratase [Daejeonella lutea]
MKELDPHNLNRRNVMKMLAVGSTAGLLGLFDSKKVMADTYETPSYQKGLAPVKIKSVRAIGCAPGGPNLVVVRVDTTEPGLYGIGCATFNQRATLVVAAVNTYLNEFCVGKDVDNIEDMWQSCYVSSYWRNGPVLNNALSGLDEALWDIKGKRAGMPVYQLLGGKSRFAVPVYVHADGRTPEAVADNVQKFIAEGNRYVRIQQGLYGATQLATAPDFKDAGFGMPRDGFMDQREYLKSLPPLFKTVRERCGDEVELLHDMHERIEPMDAINTIKKLEDYRPFFIEDPFSPENMEWFKQLRMTTSVPIAMGELFNNINEFKLPMVNQMFDYIRCHVSQIGGITPAVKVARLGEWFNIKTIWHGPSDTSPVGHAANCHMSLAIWNFGLLELGGGNFGPNIKEVFSGSPTVNKGYMNVSDTPGLGVDINETAAAKFPMRNSVSGWTVRKRDGTIIRP